MKKIRDDKDGNKKMKSKEAKDILFKELSTEKNKFKAFKLVVETMFDLNNASNQMNDET